MATIKLPKPLDLAKIAAALGPHDDQDKAIGNAVALYLRAVTFCDNHKNDSVEDLVTASGDLALLEEVCRRDAKAQDLCLDQTKRDDDARKFLKASGKPMQRASTVLENLLELLQIRSKHQNITSREDDAKKTLELWKCRATDEHEFYMIPKSFLQNLVEWKRWKKHQGGKTSLETAAKRKVSKSS
jgi:hypothetical protein